MKRGNATVVPNLRRWMPPGKDRVQSPKLPSSEFAEKARTVGEAVLAVLATTGLIATIAIAPNAVQLFRYIPLFRDFETQRRKYQVYRVLARLRNKGFVEKTSHGFYRITAKGHNRLERVLLRGLPLANPKRWDQKWRLLMFDIPEGVRIRRDLLRKHLEQLGFILLQKSVWMYPFPCEDILELLRRRLELGRARVRCLIAEAFDGDQEYREHFGLPSPKHSSKQY